MFAVMIAIHEFGHFSAAKLFGIRVNQFAIGMGPVIWKKQGKKKRSIPCGQSRWAAFAKWRAKTPQATTNAPSARPRGGSGFLVVIAGATLNIVLGFVIFNSPSTSVGGQYDGD